MTRPARAAPGGRRGRGPAPAGAGRGAPGRWCPARAAGAAGPGAAPVPRRREAREGHPAGHRAAARRVAGRSDPLPQRRTRVGVRRPVTSGARRRLSAAASRLSAWNGSTSRTDQVPDSAGHQSGSPGGSSTGSAASGRRPRPAGRPAPRRTAMRRRGRRGSPAAGVGRRAPGEPGAPAPVTDARRTREESPGRTALLARSRRPGGRAWRRGPRRAGVHRAAAHRPAASAPGPAAPEPGWTRVGVSGAGAADAGVAAPQVWRCRQMRPGRKGPPRAVLPPARRPASGAGRRPRAAPSLTSDGPTHGVFRSICAGHFAPRHTAEPGGAPGGAGTSTPLGPVAMADGVAWVTVTSGSTWRREEADRRERRCRQLAGPLRAASSASGRMGKRSGPALGPLSGRSTGPLRSGTAAVSGSSGRTGGRTGAGVSTTGTAATTAGGCSSSALFPTTRPTGADGGSGA